MDEKLRLSTAGRWVPAPSASPTRHPRTLVTTLALAAIALLFLYQASFAEYDPVFRSWFAPHLSEAHRPRPLVAGDSSPWTDIQPSRELEWHPCFDAEFDCARLDVPMDWQDPSDDDRVILAVIRLRARDPSAANYRGPLIFNPGGPGGSGVYAMRKGYGTNMQAVVGDNYDIVSFDPRGIGYSVPRIECWGNPQDRVLWGLQDEGLIDAHPGVVYEAFARAKAFSQTCEGTMGQESILRHSSTTSHARDMLEILDQMGQEKLSYWGFSYGTVLGGTFAAMYPDRVERLVSDGNVDLKEWYFGKYINFLHDTDKVMDAFYEFCHQAGPERCAFYRDTTEAIKSRLDALIESMRTKPVVVPSSADGPEMPEVITYSRLRRLISTMLYQPVWFFRSCAEIFAELERGEGQLFYEFYRDLRRPVWAICTPEDAPSGLMDSTASTDDAFPAVMCSDRQVNDTVQEFEDYARRLQEISAAAGAVQITFRQSCVGWDVRPKWRFDGPFSGNTSFPILYVANVADNVTPLISARNNSAGFPGSVVLVQNSYGHTSLAAPSTCTARYVREYFQDGKLPPADTVCEADVVPFYDDDDTLEAAGMPASGVEAELAVAIRKLSQEARWRLRL
ncbi:alpha/beta-hydrolase [Thozetella sp. PMI_491]|nr:alpha/beta-hydrolase [Thozetella sp. PMI_491]